MAARLVRLLAFALVVFGCANVFELVPPGRQKIGGAYTIDSPIGWSRTVDNRTEIWTVDGPFLDGIRFYTVGSGQHLVAQDKDELLPRFELQMRASEVVEFVVDSLAADGLSDIRTFELRPAKFGAAGGYRFDLQFLTQDGLFIKGMALYATIDDKLYLILYTATATYYFEKYEATVESIFNSVELI